MRKPTVLQMRLCETYVSMEKPNKGKAYQLAGYKATGETARVEAERTLRRPHVAKYLKQLTVEIAEASKLTAEQVIQNIKRIGKKAERAKKFAAALRAEQLKGEHLGMFTRKHEITGKDGGPIEINLTKTYKQER